MKHQIVPGLIAAVLAAPVHAQWNPLGGEWRKDSEFQVRVMTWNIQDNIRTGETKVEGVNAWTSIAVILASLRPDVLLLQETGDNGCGGCVDLTTELETVIDLLFHGGTDPFLGGPVTAYVQKYAPGYDLPHVFVSGSHDGFNRNVILSRYPFADCNGDTKSTYSNLFVSLPDAYAPGTLANPVIRGVQVAEIDLPDERFPGDMVVLNCHLKSGSAASDLAERLAAGQNIAYFIDHWYNGAGLGVPDPHAKIFDSPVPTGILPAQTPVVIGGDWNEDELSNGRKGPADWIRLASVTGGSDGTDRDRSDGRYDDARNACNPADRSTQSSSKLDYLEWQDSIASAVREFVFNSATIPSGCGGAYPDELMNYPATPSVASGFASDHRPVIVDLALPRNRFWLKSASF